MLLTIAKGAGWLLCCVIIAVDLLFAAAIWFGNTPVHTAAAALAGRLFRQKETGK